VHSIKNEKGKMKKNKIKNETAAVVIE